MYEHSYTCLSISVSILFRVHCHCRNFLYEMLRMGEITTTSYFLCYLNICKLSSYYVLQDIYFNLLLNTFPSSLTSVPIKGAYFNTHFSFWKIFRAENFLCISSFSVTIWSAHCIFKSFLQILLYAGTFFAGCSIQGVPSHKKQSKTALRGIFHL